jgi:hypothetical protein
MKSDATLKKVILAELNWAPAVNAEHIGVEVRWHGHFSGKCGQFS